MMITLLRAVTVTVNDNMIKSGQSSWFIIKSPEHTRICTCTADAFVYEYVFV